ncbi:unnamed protein product [Acanthocheilonema viteae]|uniref:Uncharacterized protein n=1 Tax=Acanthocheilonema viteae TaxID=6277 RepID=A0A498S7S4_ACAVI|nr:unnamed protein product [Acanthocheilonema viteae]
MSVVHIALLLVVLPNNRPVNSQLICTSEASGLNEKRICFDLDKGRFINPKIGRNSHEHAVATIFIAAARRSTERIWGGWSVDMRDVPYALRNTYIRVVHSATLINQYFVQLLKHAPVRGKLATVSGIRADSKSTIDAMVTVHNNTMYDLPASIPRETEMWHGKEENNNGKFSNGEFSTSGFRACLNNAIDGQRAAQAYIHRLGNWTLFEWVISFQATIIVLNVLSALAVSIVEYLNPRPMLLLALILFIPIFPTLYSNQHEENLKLFGWIQLVCGFVELFWSSCVLLDMHYHSNDWRAYFAMCAVSWQVKVTFLITFLIDFTGGVVKIDCLG